MAAKEKSSSRLSAWLAPLLLLLAAVAVAVPASASMAGALETRAWEKTSAPLESRPIESLQLLEGHQSKAIAAYNDALGSPLAAEGAAAKFATNPGEAVFWSGRTAGVGGADVAGDIAASQGGTTLEQLAKARGIDLPVWDAGNPASVQAWQDASRAFAGNAQGTVRAVIGDSLRPGNVWETVELPALKANPNVTQIIRVNPATGAQTVIFTR
jgi:hypothetical protein